MKSYVFLFDLDMVLADWTHRLPLIHITKIDGDTPMDISPANDPKPIADWDGFYAAMPRDPVIPAGCVLYNFLVTQAQIVGHAVEAAGKELQGAEVPYVDVITCRPERTRQVTMEWFVANGLLAPRRMHMREDLDVRPHHEIKMEMYQKYYAGKEEVLCLWDDNEDTIRAFRSIGVTVYDPGRPPLQD